MWDNKVALTRIMVQSWQQVSRSRGLNDISSMNKKVSTDKSGRLVKVAAMLLLPILVAGIAACDSNSSATPTTGISTLVPPSGTSTASTTAVNSRAPYED